MTSMNPEEMLNPRAGARKGVTVLESVDVQVCLRGLLEHTEVTQTYRNEEDKDIEAVYVFPMPRDAVLLDLSLELNGKTLKAEVYEKPEAQEKYEDAVGDGDSAILLEKLESGLFALNAGNVRPGERAVVRFQYAQLHRWQGSELRLHVPTTLAPRYGTPDLPLHQVPEYTLLPGAEFSMKFRIEGPLAQAEFECPSHEAIKASESDGVLELSLSKGRAPMDRDVVLVLRKPAGFSACGIWARELAVEETGATPPVAGPGEYVSLVSFHPTVGQGMSNTQRCVILVVDCSGSMAGDSIAQAKEALQEILNLLTPNDYFNLIRFGSNPNPLFQKPVAASTRNIGRATTVVEEMNASMGGTDIASALEMAYHSPKAKKGLKQDILLITDGAVWDCDGDVMKRAQASGCRLFTVGVGSSVSEGFLRDLAEQTGGACELVSPKENMARRIVRQFQRAGQLCVDSVNIEWPEGWVRQHPERIEEMFLGDTLHVWGWFREPPSGPVKLAMAFQDGQEAAQTVDLWLEQDEAGRGPDSLSRVALRDQLPGMDPEEALREAMRYRLVTEWTSYVLVHEREEGQKADGCPELRQVPHTLAAGWGGMGSVLASCVVPDSLDRATACAAPMPDLSISKAEGFRNLMVALNARAWRKESDLPRTLSELGALGLLPETVRQLENLFGEGVREEDLVIAFLALLSLGYKKQRLSPDAKRAIWSVYRQTALSPDVVAGIAATIDGSLKPRDGDPEESMPGIYCGTNHPGDYGFRK